MDSRARSARAWAEDRLLAPWRHCGRAEVSGALGDLGTFLPLTVRTSAPRLRGTADGRPAQWHASPQTW